MAPETPLEEQRQTADLDTRWIVIVAAGTLLLVGATLGLVWLFERVAGVHGAEVIPPAAFAPPRLQSDPAGDFRAYQAEQRARLEAYGWADRERGLVRIPIERAMGMIATRGAGAYDPLDPPRRPDPRR
ncbi:hypothetical protein JMJ55_25685 [Belnapia sp. T6]|uniref:Uncharacterized protein n=1 Tax=Belnapia mucosa TaxID=2804532 RepID=A0ABS1VAN5_9PROT|nr:hypothetical protein [Belnapia mucosa]MBL6458731.1 hypothetical protein [Belnapia mucosa]